jgi:hypothetical protein
MKLLSTLAGLVMLGGVALSTGTVSAMSVMNPHPTAQTGLVQQAALVCNAWGHCWQRPFYGYYHPHYFGGWGWHPHYYGGWGWHPWWHRWHHWNYW